MEILAVREMISVAAPYKWVSPTCDALAGGHPAARESPANRRIIGLTPERIYNEEARSRPETRLRMKRGVRTERIKIVA